MTGAASNFPRAGAHNARRSYNMIAMDESAVYPEAIPLGKKLSIFDP